MRVSKAILIGLICTATLISGVSFAKPKPPEPAKEDVAELEYQVAALKMLRELSPTAEQVQLISSLASDSAGKPAAIPAAPAEFKAALSEYADALADGDDDKIDAAEDKVDDLRESLKVDAAPDPTPTDGARAAADKVVAALTATQLASYMADHSDEVPDPVQTLLDAADQGRTLNGDEFNALKAEAVEQFGLLVAGVKTADAAPVAAAAGEWLDKVKKLSDKEYDAGHDQRAGEVRAMTHDVDSFTVLRHWMDREMVDLLSNPQLPGALKRLKL